MDIISHKLANKINSISQNNPIYKEAVAFGRRMLKSVIK